MGQIGALVKFLTDSSSIKISPEAFIDVSIYNKHEI
jgi:hypothetical protein